MQKKQKGSAQGSSSRLHRHSTALLSLGSVQKVLQSAGLLLGVWTDERPLLVHLPVTCWSTELAVHPLFRVNPSLQKVSAGRSWKRYTHKKMQNGFRGACPAPGYRNFINTVLTTHIRNAISAPESWCPKWRADPAVLYSWQGPQHEHGSEYRVIPWEEIQVVHYQAQQGVQKTDIRQNLDMKYTEPCKTKARTATVIPFLNLIFPIHVKHLHCRCTVLISLALLFACSCFREHLLFSLKEKIISMGK